jgi:hypothetical protein
MEDLIGKSPFISHFHYDLYQQQIIYTICKEDFIPKEKLVAYFQSEAYSTLINSLKNRIFNRNAPF